MANGSWIDINAFRMSFIPVKWLISEKYAKEKVGAIAIDRVKRTRCHLFHLRLRKPSMANCPEYVPVIVDD